METQTSRTVMRILRTFRGFMVSSSKPRLQGAAMKFGLKIRERQL